MDNELNKIVIILSGTPSKKALTALSTKLVKIAVEHSRKINQISKRKQPCN
jgi:hypothetical protein